MLKFLIRRVVNSLVLVALATCLGYLLAASALHPRANFAGRNPPPPEAVVDRTLSDLNLNDKTPLVDRFGKWVGGVVRGDLGKTVGGALVFDEMKRRMGVSLRLLLIGSILGGVLGVALGVMGAVRQYRPSDHVATLGSFLVLSIPVFLLGVLLKVGALKLNAAAGTNLLYYTGEFTPGLMGSWGVRALDRFQHFILPTLAVVLPQVAFYSRYQRSAMLDVLGSDFLRTAQAKGLRRGRALVKHGLRTALIPMATFFAYQFGLL
ncbi:MAG: ABC transporter permease, partial [Acidimicrobiia bacterium]